MKVSQKYIRTMRDQNNDATEVWNRLQEYQEKHGRGTQPGFASVLGLKVIAWSIGKYGLNGIMFQDIKTNEIYCSPQRDYLIYLT